MTSLPPDRLSEFMDDLNPAELAGLHAELDTAEQAATASAVVAEPHQMPPDGDWGKWLLLAGRRTGKSWAAAWWLDRHMAGPPCDARLPGGHLAALVAPTLGDATASGGLAMRTINPSVREVTRKGGTVAEWPSGAICHILGAYTKQDIERLRANAGHCVVVAEEFAAWRQMGWEGDAWDLAMTGLSLGPRPRALVVTTPKPGARLRAMVAQAEAGTGGWVMSRGTMDDNPHVAEIVKAELREMYAGTRLEAQELQGMLLGDVEGALWSESLIADGRVSPDQVPRLGRIVVGVDPAFSQRESADEAGVIVVGMAATATAGGRRHAYVIDDKSCRGFAAWPRAAVAAYHEHGASWVVPETNLGGEDFIVRTLHGIDPTVRLAPKSAQAPKGVRAEPYALMYDRGMVHHVGTFPALEAELTSWAPDTGMASPNRLDALVHALASLYPEMSARPVRVTSAANIRLP